MTIDELIETGKKPATPEMVEAFAKRAQEREKQFEKESTIGAEFYERAYG